MGKTVLPFSVILPKWDLDLFSPSLYLSFVCCYVGPGWLLSLAYLDPGNVEADLQLGANSKYSLLWVLLLCHIFAFFLQILSARIGLATGKSLSRVCREEYSKVQKNTLWIMAEVAVIGADIQLFKTRI